MSNSKQSYIPASRDKTVIKKQSNCMKFSTCNKIRFNNSLALGIMLALPAVEWIYTYSRFRNQWPIYTFSSQDSY